MTETAISSAKKLVVPKCEKMLVLFSQIITQPLPQMHALTVYLGLSFHLEDFRAHLSSFSLFLENLTQNLSLDVLIKCSYKSTKYLSVP